MAEPIYDSDQDLDKLTPEAIRELEDKYSTEADQAEDQAIEDGADPEDLERKGMGRKLRQRSEAQDEERADAVNKQLQDKWQAAKAEHENRVGRGYRKRDEDNKGLVNRIREQRRRLIIGGSIAAVFIAVGLAFFGFLNVFKLDDIMSNIDAKTFARLNGVEDRRSLAWMQAYMEVRMLDVGDKDKPDLRVGPGSDNLLFRSNKVSTGNPIMDWYSTLRTSNFERDVFNKNGILFTSSIGPDGKIRAGKITVDKQVFTLDPTALSKDEFKKLQTGDLSVLADKGPLEKFVKVSIFDNDAQARSEIRTAVQDGTHFFQVFKRRQVRKDIQNMAGVRSWRFFENTRNSVNETKIDIRNKIIAAAVPEGTLSGKFIRCLFGISDCRFSDDPSDVQYQSEAALDGNNNPNNTSEPLKETDANGNLKKNPSPIDLGLAADNLKQITATILKQANFSLQIANIVSTLDSFNKVNKALTSGELSKGVAIARGVQAMGLYQVFETSRDQLKTGEVTSAEVNKFMEVIGPIASSEGWVKVINGQGNASQLTNTAASEEYCSAKHQAILEANIEKVDNEFAYLCPDKQIGGSSNAASLENGYKQTIGKVLDPILAAYNKIRNAPIIGGLLNLVNKIVGSVNEVFTGIIRDVLSAVGLQDNLDNAMRYIMTKMMSFLGAGPIMTGNEPAGQYMNWLVQGGAFTAEASARANGAALSTPQSQASAQLALAQYQTEQQSSRSVIDKYFSLSNPNSPVSNLALDLSQTNHTSISGMLLNFGNAFKNVAAAFYAPFNGRSWAADNGYTGANFAGIKTFDYPQQCEDLNPITAQPLDGTNALQIFKANNINVSPDNLKALSDWSNESNSITFYQIIYSVITADSRFKDKADTIAEQIYNCNLLDNTVRGSMGYVYGYTNDNGLD